MLIRDNDPKVFAHVEPIIASESEVYAMGADGPVLVAKCMSTLAVIPQRERFRPQA